MTVLIPFLSVLAVFRTPVPLNTILVFFDTGLTGFIGINEYKHAMAVSKALTAFRAHLMAVNLSRLTTGTMNDNVDHKKTSKVGIIHQFQLIEHITIFINGYI